jgi:hypothetical protein
MVKKTWSISSLGSQAPYKARFVRKVFFSSKSGNATRGCFRGKLFFAQESGVWCHFAQPTTTRAKAVCRAKHLGNEFGN